MLLGQRVDEESLKAVNRELGLDLPWHKQYLLYLNDISPISLHKTNPSSSLFLDDEKYNYTSVLQVKQTVLVLKTPYLRRSFQSRKPVSEIIAEALPGTVILALVAIGFALVFGIFFGVISSVHQGKFIDSFALFSAVLGMSAPSFFSAIIISWIGGYLWADAISLPAIPFVFALAAVLIMLFRRGQKSTVKVISFGIKGLLVGVGILIINNLVNSFSGVSFLPSNSWHFTLPGTGLNMTGSLYDVDVFEGEYLALENLILPAITLGIRPLAIVMQLTRNAMLDVLSQDYIRTARAKGLSKFKILYKHALRNALNPVITAVSGWFASMLAGAVFIEFIFNWKGLGLRIFQSLQNDDYPVVMGSVLVIAAAFVIINILVDILYGILDPRVRIK